MYVGKYGSVWQPVIRVKICESNYRKPPTISPGLIYFRKRFLMGLYKGGLIHGGGGAYTWTIFCVSNKQSQTFKQVSHKQENKHVLSSDYWAYIKLIRGAYIRVGLYSGGGLIFGMR